MDLFEIGNRDEPYEAFNELRETSALHEGPDGYWYVTRYADIQRILRDPALVSGTGVIDSLGLTHGPLYDAMTSWLMALDGEAHARVRRLISGVFTPRAVEALRARIDAIVAMAVTAMQAARDADGVDVVPPLTSIPMEVMRVLFGVDRAEWETEVVAAFFSSAGPVAMMDHLLDFVRRLVAARRHRPGDDMFSRLFAADDAGETLSDDELVANGVLLITAGFDTTSCLLGNLVYSVFTRTEVVRALSGRPRLVPAAIEETLRFETPALTTSRRTTSDVGVGDSMIPAGQNVLFALAAGNRDPRRYERPDEFDVHRDDIRPLSFGGGLHVCVGAGLGRLEAQCVLSELLGRFPRLEVDPLAVTWRKDNPTVRGPATLLVALP